MTGDFLKIPITVTNNKAQALNVEVVTRERYSSWSKNGTRDVNVGGNSVAQTIFEFDTRKLQYDNSEYSVDVALLIDGIVVDWTRRTCFIMPMGNEIKITKAGYFSPDEPINFQVNLPKLRTTRPIFDMQVFTTELEYIESSLKSFVNLPTGCFEQNSALIYVRIVSIYIYQAINDFLSITNSYLREIYI